MKKLTRKEFDSLAEEYSELFSKKIKELMSINNITQIQLGEAMGERPQNTISKWINGINMPNVATFLTMCHVLEVSPEYFFIKDLKVDQSTVINDLKTYLIEIKNSVDELKQISLKMRDPYVYELIENFQKLDPESKGIFLELVKKYNSQKKS